MDIVFSFLMFAFGISSIHYGEFGFRLGNSNIILLLLKDRFAAVWGGFLIAGSFIHSLTVIMPRLNPDLSVTAMYISMADFYILGFIFGMCVLLQYAVYLGQWLGKYKRSELIDDNPLKAKH